MVNALSAVDDDETSTSVVACLVVLRPFASACTFFCIGMYRRETLACLSYEQAKNV